MINFMAEDFEYYRIYKTDDLFVPIVSMANVETSRCFYSKKIVDNPPTLQFFLCKPVPKKLGPVDLMTCPRLIFSDKIADVLRPLDIDDVQLIPSELVDEKTGDSYTGAELNYWGLHICKFIECVDTELSNLRVTSGGIRDMRKLVLNKKILKEIPLEERLIFTLKEDYGYTFFHKSIVDKIMSVKPTNIRFVNIENVTVSRPFEI